MAMTDWHIVRRSMTGRLFSTVVTAVSVGVAVALMTMLLSMRSSGRAAFERGTGNAQLLISREPSALTSVLNGLFYADAPGTPIPWSDFERLRDAYPFAWALPTQAGDSYRGSPVVATVAGYFGSFEPAPGERFEIAEGRVFERPFEIVAGSRAARDAGLRVGSSIALSHGMNAGEHGHHGHHHEGFEFTVVGVLRPTGSAHDRALFTDLVGAWTVHAHDRRESEMGEGVRTTPDDVTDADRQITGVLASLGPRTAALTQILSELRRDPDWTVAQPADTVRGLFSIVSSVDQILVAMAGAVVGSSGVSIMLALYNSMGQRRRQIAVLRVLGASRWRIVNLVLGESACLGLLGGMLGVAIGVGASAAVSGVLRERLGLVIHPTLPVEGYLAMVVGTIALSMLAGVIPAAAAYRTPVVRSLRPLG